MRYAADFISEAALDGLLCLPPDKLEHDKAAKSLLRKAVILPPGSVIAIQGAWGTGKTDLLARIAKLTRGELPTGIARASSWINPWQYGSADLLTPLASSLARQLPKPSRKRKAISRALKTLLKAGTLFGTKGASATQGTAIKFASESLEQLVDHLLLPDKELDNDADPIARMGERFTEIIRELVPQEEQTAGGGRFIICVDDLDRCLPGQQVAMLEAIRFLTSSGAPATFIIALDPTLAHQAIATHYKTPHFDPDRYLDKLFHLRINLPALSRHAVKNLILGHLNRKVWLPRISKKETPLRDFLELITPGIPQLLQSRADTVFTVPSLRNPRIIHRVFDRIILALGEGLQSEGFGIWGDSTTANRLIFFEWLAITERWPAIRRAVQDVSLHENEEEDEIQIHLDIAKHRLGEIFSRYRMDQTYPSESTQIEASIARYGYDAVVRMLPSPEEAPELAQSLTYMEKRHGVSCSGIIQTIEIHLQRIGL